MADTPESPRRLSAEQRALLDKRRKGMTSSASPQISPIPRLPSDAPRYASLGQERLWFVQQYQPSSSAYHMTSALRLTGKLDVNALRDALNSVLARHEALRTAFVLHEDRLLAQVREDLRIELPEFVITGDDVASKIRELANQPFDLAQGPLLRAALLRQDEMTCIMVLVLHHIIADEWSLEIIWRELNHAYNVFVKGEDAEYPPPALPYSDFAAWQRDQVAAGVYARDLAYWMEQLAGDLPILQLPTDRPRSPVRRYQGGFTTRSLPTETCQALVSLSRREGMTLFGTLASAFQVFLHRYSGQTDILIGTPVTHRTHPDVEAAVGFFLNTLVLRADMSQPLTFVELLSRGRELQRSALAHQGLPFDHLVEALKPPRDPSYNPVFQAMFVYQDGQPSAPALTGLNAEVLTIDAGIAKFDLTLFARHHEGEIQLSLEYGGTLFERATAERMLLHLETLIANMVRTPEIPLSQISMLPDLERRQLLDIWTGTQIDYPRDLRIHDLIAQQPPAAVAVIAGAASLTYGELNARADALAQRLIALGAKVGAFVGLCVERSPDMIVGIVAILKAGAAYVPIDPAYPAERIEHIFNDADIRILLTQKALVDRLPDRVKAIVLLDGDDDLAAAANDMPAPSVTPDDLAYMIYTSGSTGLPKGVRVSHRNLVHSTTARFHYYAAPSKRFLLLSSFAFDSSVAGIFWTLCQGGALCLPPPGDERDVTALAAIIARDHVTHTLMLPSLYAILLEFAPADQLRSLEVVMVAGEACPADLPALHYRLLPDAGLYNEYGPTEATVWSTVWRIPPTLDRMLIGSAIPNMQTYILEPTLEPTPIGVTGELYVGGEGVTEGYHNRPELTSERFIANPFGAGRLYRTGDLARYQADGNIEFLGRVDHQVKINGYRIELGEIETLLASFPGVQESVVLALDRDMDDAVLTRLLTEVEAMSEDEAVAQLRTLQQTAQAAQSPAE